MDGCVRRGEFGQAILEAQRLLLIPDLPPDQRGTVFRLLGRARSESGDPWGGLKALEMAIPLALATRDWDCLGKTRAELGITWLVTGNYRHAVESFLAYLLDYRHYDSARSYLGSVHYNLGLSYRRRRDNERAAQHYREALEWFSERGYTLQAGQTHQNLSWLYCLEGEYEAAEAEIQLAETFADVCGAEFKTEQLVCRAFVHMLRKELVMALYLTGEVLQPNRPGTTDGHRAHACWLTGRCSLDLRNLDTALSFARFAEEYAIRAMDTAVMSMANSLKAEVVRRQQGNNEAAW